MRLTPEPSTWLDWVTAVGSVLATLVPAGLFAVEHQGRKAAEAETRVLRERERADAESRELAGRAAAERAQADLVHAWVGVSVIADREPCVFLVNSSSMPVSMLRFVGLSKDMEGESETSVSLRGGRVQPPTPGAPRVLPVAQMMALDQSLVYHDPAAFTLSEFSFTDAAGRRWKRRYSGGGLGQLEPADPLPVDEAS